MLTKCIFQTPNLYCKCCWCKLWIWFLLDSFSSLKPSTQTQHLQREWQPGQMLHSIDVDDTTRYVWCSHQHALGLYTRFPKDNGVIDRNMKQLEHNRDDPPAALSLCVSQTLWVHWLCGCKAWTVWRVLQRWSPLKPVTKNNCCIFYICWRAPPPSPALFDWTILICFSQNGQLSLRENWDGVLYTSEEATAGPLSLHLKAQVTDTRLSQTWGEERGKSSVSYHSTSDISLLQAPNISSILACEPLRFHKKQSYILQVWQIPIFPPPVS